jgi:golgi apyrase
MVNPEKWHYGIVLDAGSSGTRIYIYRWLHNERARLDPNTKGQLPEIISKSKWTKKVHIGLSTYGPTPSLIGDDHLAPLVKHALEYVPKELVPETPVFLLATAGMRLLPESQQQNVLSTVCSYFQEQTDFYLPDCGLHVQIIPGETEGLYGWIAANYLVGGFKTPVSAEHDHGKDHHTYGFLDMGGASSQIAFVPNATEVAKHSNDLKLLRLRKIDGSNDEYKVFTTTWLGYGVNEARRRYLEDLIDRLGASLKEYPDPCLPAGVLMSLDSHDILDIDTKDKHLIGTGEIDQCLKDTRPLLKLDAPCLDEPCLLNGQHVPSIDFDVNHFIGISNYWHSTHEIFEMGYDDKAYDFATYQTRVRDFCSTDWDTTKSKVASHEWGKKVDEQTAEEVCFKASWLINMLHDGIGVPRVGLESNTTSKPGTFTSPFQAVDEIKDTEVTWTLGKILLYASSTIPALTTGEESIDAAPVGFGSNTGALIPSDFIYPSLLAPTNPSIPTAPKTGTGLVDKVSSTIFRSDASHRLPGFIFLLLILCTILFFFFRRRIATALGFAPTPTGRFSRKPPKQPLLRRLLAIALGKHSTTSYSRLAPDPEADGMLHDPAEFELRDFDEEALDDDGDAKAAALKKAGALRPSTIDRAGLVVRTESRERLDLDGLRGSRSGSPKAKPGAGAGAPAKGGLGGMGRTGELD